MLHASFRMHSSSGRAARAPPHKISHGLAHTVAERTRKRTS